MKSRANQEMIDPIGAPAGVPPPAAATTAASGDPQGQIQTAPAAPQAGAPTDDTAAPAKAATPAVDMDVQRGQGGVFVYTLRDPATDVVLAVIPRAEVLSPSQGRTLDERV